jgi:hypothetical protein
MIITLFIFVLIYMVALATSKRLSQALIYAVASVALAVTFSFMVGSLVSSSYPIERREVKIADLVAVELRTEVETTSHLFGGSDSRVRPYFYYYARYEDGRIKVGKIPAHLASIVPGESEPYIARVDLRRACPDTSNLMYFSWGCDWTDTVQRVFHVR